MKIIDFPQLDGKNSDLNHLLEWYNTHNHWFTGKWVIQIATQKKLCEDNNPDVIEEIIFLNICPESFLSIINEFDEESYYSIPKTRFIRKKIEWEDVLELLRIIFSLDQNNQVHNYLGLKMVFNKNEKYRVEQRIFFHHNINKTPFSPYYFIQSKLQISYTDGEVILFPEKIFYRSLKDTIIDIFMKKIVTYDPRLEDNLHLPLFSITFPITSLTLNKIAYDSRNFTINYNYNPYGTMNRTGLILVPYDKRKHKIEHSIKVNEDNVIPCNFGSYLEFRIFELNEEEIPIQILCKGRVGVSEEEIKDLSLNDIDSEMILKICEQGENQFFEFKREDILYKSGRANLLLEIAAFANTITGFIFIGISDLPEDKGEISGIEDLLTKKKKTKNTVVTMITEDWIKELDPIPIIHGKVVDIGETGHSVIVLKTIFDKTKTPVTYKGKVVTRVHSSVNPASQAEILRLVDRKGSSEWGLF